MTDAASITFHVVFVPGAVRDLRIFMPSLAAWGGGARFRLVSNGCSPAEDEQLRQLVKLSPRFDFLRLPGEKMWSHGKALSYLQRRETGARFAFLDSDIFATGDFLGDLCFSAGAVDALFSCPPVWSNDQLKTVPHGFKLANGHYQQMEDGFCIGGSYFAIYDNHILGDCMTGYGIDFCTYWWERIPTAIRLRLKSAERTMALYDTTKLVNILLNLDGNTCQFVTTRHLHHIGGVSCHATSQCLSRLIRRGILALVPDIVRRLAARAGVRNDWRETVSSEEFRCQCAEIARRQDVCAYIFRLMHSLDKCQPQGGSYVSCDADLDDKVRCMEATIRQLHPTWCAWLDGSVPIGTVPDVHTGLAVWPQEVGDASAA